MSTAGMSFCYNIGHTVLSRFGFKETFQIFPFSAPQGALGLTNFLAPLALPLYPHPLFFFFARVGLSESGQP